jgi:acetoin utilization protein AcuB
MRIRDLMSTNVTTVSEKTSIYDATKIMKAHKIRRLPVMKKNKLVGLVTERMLLEAAPSPATTLSVWELNYLLSRMTVKDIMVKKPYTISPDMPAEEALELGQEMGYGAFPVTEHGSLVGMVTESDIVRFMTRVLGVRENGKRRENGNRIDIRVSKEFGSMQKIMTILDQNRAVLLSLMSFRRPYGEDYMIALRVKSDNAEPITKQLASSGFDITYVG